MPNARTWMLLLVLGLTACDEDDTKPVASDAGPVGDTDANTGDAGDDGDAASDGMASAEPGDPLPQGEWLVGVYVKPFDLVLPMYWEIEGSVIRLSGVQVDDGAPTELLATVEDVTAREGQFEFSTNLTLPMSSTPTGAVVEVDLDFSGQVRDAMFLCGDVAGEAVTFTADLEGSTFGATPWLGSPAGVRGSCEPPEPIARIEDCPTLVAGPGQIESGGTTRDFEIVLPGDYDSAQSYPLLFVYHGFGGVPADYLDGQSQLRPYADSEDIIIVAPQGLGSAGGGARWNTSTASEFNVDVALFDDLLKCISEQYSVDEDRIHSTGMSFGGLMTTTLLATRGNVLASVAPFSGGVTLDYEDTGSTPPVLISWGGPEDFSSSTDFAALAEDMIDLLGDKGHFRVLCDHGLMHDFRTEFWPWALRFMLDHPRGADTSAYAAMLPDVFPDYCTVAD